MLTNFSDHITSEKKKTFDYFSQIHQSLINKYTCEYISLYDEKIYSKENLSNSRFIV